MANENEPLEPAQVHAAKGVPTPNATKIWITKAGKCLLCNNDSRIPLKTIRNIMDIIEARSNDVPSESLENQTLQFRLRNVLRNRKMLRMA